MSIKGTELDQLIVNALLTSDKPLGAYNLLARMRPFGVTAPLTVYRSLSRLASSGRIHRIESLSAYVPCREGHGEDSPHRTPGFAICDGCGIVEEFDDPIVLERLEADASVRSFVPRAMTLEIRGVCVNCREVARPTKGSPDR
jgi:Fur family zinc uptake transcriptional regulator